MRQRTIAASLTLLALAPLAAAYDVTDKLSINGVLSGAGQCQKLSEDAGFDDECKGALSVRPEISLRPTDNDELFMKFGFATGNGLNTNAEEGRFRSPFALVTWAADLEDDVENINGRSRDYLLTVLGTNEEFVNASGAEDDEALLGATLSFDQQLGDNWGAFLRLAWQDDDAAVLYDAQYSGGLNIKGGLWGRVNDNVGVGLAYLNGGNQDLDKTQVAEIYYRLVMGSRFALTADVQYMKDELKEGGDDPRGWILGLRATPEF